jgi:hypothetical protein
MIQFMRAVRSYGLAFLGFGIPMGFIAGLGTGLWLGSATAGLLAGLAGCGIMGGAFALVIGTLDLVADRDGRHGGPAGPRQEASVPVPAGSDLPDRIESALRQLNGEIRQKDVAAGRYLARTRWSWRSFGENVAVELTGDPAAPVAHITSHPVVRTTLIDYGKGRRNVQQVAAALRLQSE